MYHIAFKINIFLWVTQFAIIRNTNTNMAKNSSINKLKYNLFIPYTVALPKTRKLKAEILRKSYKKL